MEINKENFDKEIKTDGIVIVDFFATWCGPCQMLSPILEELSTTYKVCKVNVDENQELAREYGIMSIPTVFIYKDGKQTNKFIGYKTKEEIEKLLKEE
ncbi:MAG: thioredoxin [Firmicutes bacterium]|nr:thioredoxin [Bacillota bacterium]